MSPKEAKESLKRMGVIEENVLGMFKVIKFPKKVELDEFVYAIKSLSVWSIKTERTDRRVEISRGTQLYDLFFKLS